MDQETERDMMKIRKFDFGDKGPMICEDGDFLHINDITLLIMKEREFAENCLSQNENRHERSDIEERMSIRYKERIELLDSLLDKIRKGVSY